MSNVFNAIRAGLGIGASSSRKIARDRLSIMLVHQRNSQLLESVDMIGLQREVAVVVQKYIKVAQDKAGHVTGINFLRE